MPLGVRKLSSSSGCMAAWYASQPTRLNPFPPQHLRPWGRYSGVTSIWDSPEFRFIGLPCSSVASLFAHLASSVLDFPPLPLSGSLRHHKGLIPHRLLCSSSIRKCNSLQTAISRLLDTPEHKSQFHADYPTYILRLVVLYRSVPSIPRKTTFWDM